MKNLILILLTLNTSLIFSQEKLELVTSLSGSFEKEIISNWRSQVYGSFAFDLGTRLNLEKGGLDFLVIYKFSSNVIAFKDQIAISDNPQYVFYNSVLRSHFFGGALKYTFFNREKSFRPYIKFIGLTELTSNYKNGYLKDDEFIPKDVPSATYYYPAIPGGEYTVNYYYSNFYHSTPLASSLLGGIDIKLAQNLSLNIAAGYAFRIMKIKYAEWKENEDVYKKLETKPTENVFSHFLDVQLGVSYSFPLKKTSKSD